jgi:hypothetical protein
MPALKNTQNQSGAEGRIISLRVLVAAWQSSAFLGVRFAYLQVLLFAA